MSITLNSVKISDKSRKRLIIRMLLGLVECVLTVCLIIVLSADILFPEKTEAATGVSKILSYQGRLTDINGNPLGDSGTNYCFRFSIYDASSAGSKLWPSGTPTSNTVNVANGVFNVGIGEADDLSAFNFYSNDTIYLNIEVNETPTTCDGDWDSMSPRQRIDAVAYARVAGSVYGSLLRTDSDNNRVQLGDAGADPVRLLLGVKNTSDTIGDACSPSGTIWYNSNNTRALVCDNGTIQEIGNKGIIVGTAISGNTAGTPVTITSGTITLAGGANVTLSQEGNAITISAGTAGGGGSIGAISAGTTQATSGTVVFSNSNNVSFGMSEGTITASAGAAGGGISGIGASNTTFNAGTVVFSGGDNITVGTADQKIIISAANQTVQTQNMVTINGSTGAISISGGANVTVGNNANTITISVAAGGGGAAIQAGTQSVSTGTVVFSNSNGISFGMSNSSIITASYTVPTDYFSSNQSSNLMGTSERANYFATSNNTFFASANSTQLMNTSERANLQYTSANSNLMTGWSLAGAQTLGTNASAGGDRVYLSGGNMITLSGNSNTIVFSLNSASLLGTGATQSFQYTSATSAITANAMNTNERGNYFYTSNNTFFASANSTQLMNTSERANYFATSNNTFFASANSTQLMNTSERANLQYTSANSNLMTGWSLAGAQTSGTNASAGGDRVYLSGGNMITLSGNSNTIVVSLNSGSLLGTGAAASFQYTSATSAITANAMNTNERGNYFYTSNNTFANSTHSHGNPTLYLTNLSGTTASASNGLTLSLSAAAPGGGGGIADISVNAANGSTNFTSGTVIFAAGNTNITLSSGNQAISIYGPSPGGGGGVTLSHWPPFPVNLVSSSNYTGATAAGTNITASFNVAPLQLQAALSFSRINIFESCGTIAGTGSQSIAHMVGIYTLNAGTALSLSTSYMFRDEISQNSVTAHSHRWYWGTNSTANSSSTGGNTSANFTGLRVVPLFVSAAGDSLSAGQYYLVYAQTNRSNSVAVMPCASILAISGSQSNLGGQLGSASTFAPFPLIGYFSSTTVVGNYTSPFMPASIATNNMTMTSSAQWKWPYVQFLGK